ncbi:sensor histidine kinase [Flavobacterium proteolyticum]|uniref:Histidine kinase n=1 Tax=Flavobacterium proteolyticum TaxID=2911683 RepID=A0ABR9WV65_9FLAO|nr:histidine kinase [Flavobacterium proteolyticum]MBE9577512.1 histidine kinase [Flavobacterium proteolyticum]
MKIILIFFTIVFLNLNSLFSQTYNSIKELNVESGLPSDVIYNVVQDNEGYIWIATENGVVKYNGTTYKIFQKKEGLPNNDIFKLDVDSKNRIWLTGFHKGLYYIENEIVKKVNNTDHLKGITFTFEKDGTPFFKTIYDKKSFCLNKKKELLNYYINKQYIIDYDKSNFLYVGFNPKQRKYFVLKNGKIKYAPKNHIYCKNIFHNKISFINHNPKLNPYFIKRELTDYISYFEKDTFLILNTSFFKKSFLNLENDSKYNIIKDNDNYFIYKNGIYNNYLSKKINDLKTLTKNLISIYIDTQENFWLVYNDNKLKFIPNDFDNIISYKLSDILGDNSGLIKHSVLSKNDEIFFITSNHILFKFNLKSNKIKILKKYKFKQPQKLILDENFLTVCFNDEIEYINLLTNEIKTKKIYNRNIEKIENDLYYVNMSRINKNENILFEKNNDLRFNTIFILHDKKIYTSNEDEVICYDEINNKQYENKKIRYTNIINGSKNFIFIGTNSEGLYLLNKTLNIKDRTLINENITSIEKDDLNQNFYIASNKAIYLFKIKKNKFELISTLNLKDVFINGKILEMKFKKDKLYVTSTKSIYIISNKIFLENKIIGKIDLDSISANGLNFKKNNTINFKRTQNNISINTSLFSFQNPSKFKKFYTVIKNGERSKWILFNENTITFRELSHGDYIIKFKLLSTDEKEIYNTNEIHFKIQPYYWETLLFKVLTIIAFALLIFITYRYYQRKSLRKYNLKLKLNTLELKALKAQMNPHFIFNSLNNFQSLYILEGEKSANQFLSKFSFFIRKTLDIVNKDTISLFDELEFIKTYIEIESLKNNIKIDLKINIDENLQINNLSIPVMIIQPIVENSIIHGLLPSKNEKEIVINIQKTEHKIEIIIEDNGIGFNQIKKQGNNNHKSYATKIIKDRIKILNILSKKDTYELTTEDINKQNTLKQGTRVKFVVPIVEII